MKRRGFFVALAALPFIGKLIKNPTGPFVPKLPYEPPTLTKMGDWEVVNMPPTWRGVHDAYIAAKSRKSGRLHYYRSGVGVPFPKVEPGDTVVMMPQHRETLTWRESGIIPARSAVRVGLGGSSPRLKTPGPSV